MSKSEREPTQRIPVVSTRLKLFGDGTQGVLLGTACRDCGVYYFGSQRICQNCMSRNMQAVELSREGTLYTFTIVRTPAPGWQGRMPYILGEVELPEGPLIPAEVVDCPEEALKIGMSMELTLRVGGEDKENNEVVVYKWRPSVPSVK